MPGMEPASQAKTMVGGFQHEGLLWDFMEGHLWQRHSPGWVHPVLRCPGFEEAQPVEGTNETYVDYWTHPPCLRPALPIALSVRFLYSA